MGGQRKRDVGMPKAMPMPKHFVEIMARADQPISAGFSFYAESTMPGVPGTGMPSSTRTVSRYGARSFIPQAGQNYEVTAGWGNDCAVQVVQLVIDTNGVVQRVPMPSQLAGACSVASGAPS
ncbi:hypothetical protein ACHZ97_04365 [Lysobacter soli]|uniref:hypothetical protein n=1 Tax=Lysobacter soli TaxID=453783 RepID=UPI0037C94C65